MERFLNAALNISHEGTETCCPLDTTVLRISDNGSSSEADGRSSCDLSAEELEEKGENLTI